MAKCKSCGKEIFFIKTKQGKFMPCDTAPHSVIVGEGNMILLTKNGDVVRGKPASYDDGADTTGYISHFSTCPAADQFRKG